MIRNSNFGNNDRGVYVSSTATPDFGNLNDADTTNDGNNNFFCNSSYHFYSENSSTIMAENNFWGQSPPNSAMIYGSVDYDPYLGGASSILLRSVRTRKSGSDIILSWESGTANCGYIVYRSSRSDGGFTDISGTIYQNSFTDTGACGNSVDYYYTVEVVSD